MRNVTRIEDPTFTYKRATTAAQALSRLRPDILVVVIRVDGPFGPQYDAATADAARAYWPNLPYIETWQEGRLTARSDP